MYIIENNLRLYLLIFITVLAVVFLAILISLIQNKVLKKKKTPKLIKDVKLRRSIKNPILSPRSNKWWEVEGSFNPGVVRLGGETYLLYRAIGNDGVSRIGYAKSSDGIHIDDRSLTPVFSIVNPRSLNEPSYKQVYDPVMYPSGGSWGGCEDPRLIKIDNTIYMIFNAFDGWDFLRIGVTSIKESDFKKKNWQWTKPLLISPKGEVNKNWVIFPEKVNGKFAILHSLSPEVGIDYVDRLEELSNGYKVIKSKFSNKVPRETWDTWVRGAGPPPMKTEKGWLVLYHAINKNEPSRYRLGAMLLDLKNPKKIIARSASAILLPDMWYENDGKPGVVYACGAVIDKDLLYVYYGGGDRHSCVATTPIKNLLNDLIKRGKMSDFKPAK
jgi:predicted GH43/DUF377 family glycosyl hydrolase